MTFTLQADAPPLREDQSGALRVGESNVLLELVIRAYQDGATPETIVKRYDFVPIRDIYAVIAYYLRHREDVDAYLMQREELAEEVAQRIRQQQGDLSQIRARIDSHRGK